MTKQTGTILKATELLVWAVLIVAALVLVGCGGGDTTDVQADSRVVVAVHNPEVRP